MKASQSTAGDVEPLINPRQSVKPGTAAGWMSSRFLPAALFALALTGAWGTAQAQALQTVDCSTDFANVFNTGDNGNGGILTSGNDLNWEVSNPGISNPVFTPGDYTAITRWQPAVLVTSPPGAWYPNQSNAAWISQAANGVQNPALNGDVFYRLQFYLAADVDPSAFQLSLNFYADNSVYEVWINGLAQSTVSPSVGTLPQSPTNAFYYEGSYNGSAGLALYTLSQGWQTGLNTLIVDVKSSTPNVGFLAKISEGQCTIRPTVHITKSTSSTTALAPGSSVTYTVTASNTGSVAANNVAVADSFPAGIANATWTCTDSAGGSLCPAASSGGTITAPATLLNQTIASLPAGGTVTYTIVATTASSGLPPVIANTATANVSGGVCVDASGQPTGEPMPCPSTVSNPSAPIITFTKTASTTAALAAGEQLTYTVTVKNSSNADANNVEVKDPLAPGIAAMTWTCGDSAGGSLCPADSTSGTASSLDETIASLPANSTVTYTITATVAASGLPATISNVATANLSGGLCADGQAMPCSATVTNPSITATSGSSATTTPIPTLGEMALAALALLLLGLAWLKLAEVKRKQRN